MRWKKRSLFWVQCLKARTASQRGLVLLQPPLHVTDTSSLSTPLLLSLPTPISLRFTPLGPLPSMRIPGDHLPLPSPLLVLNLLLRLRLAAIQFPRESELRKPVSLSSLLRCLPVLYLWRPNQIRRFSYRKRLGMKSTNFISLEIKRK